MLRVLVPFAPAALWRRLTSALCVKTAMKKFEFAEDILEYLHLEYGETPSDLNALKLSELKFVGQFLLDGSPTYFW